MPYMVIIDTASLLAGTPSEEALYQCINAAYRHCIQVCQLHPQEVRLSDRHTHSPASLAGLSLCVVCVITTFPPVASLCVSLPEQPEHTRVGSRVQVVLYGRSIGTGPSVDLASRTPSIGGLVLEAPLGTFIDSTYYQIRQ